MGLIYDANEATAHLARADCSMARLIERAGPFTLRPPKLQSPFEALLRSIVYQQLSGRAAATIYARLQAVCIERGGMNPQSILDSPDDALRSAGISRGKLLAIRDLAGKASDGTVPTLARLRKMDDAEIMERLVQVRGIGPWTVEMLLIFRLGRPDVLPASDLGVRKGFGLTYRSEELPASAIIVKRGERWRPFRSVASWYLWRAVDLQKQAELQKAPKGNQVSGLKKPVATPLDAS